MKPKNAPVIAGLAGSALAGPLAVLGLVMATNADLARAYVKSPSASSASPSSPLVPSRPRRRPRRA